MIKVAVLVVLFAFAAVVVSAAEEASPEPYAYQYADAQGTHGKAEQSDGNTVTGYYYVADPENGHQRRVDYIADQDGFRASVQSNHEALVAAQAPMQHHQHLQHAGIYQAHSGLQHSGIHQAHSGLQHSGIHQAHSGLQQAGIHHAAGHLHRAQGAVVGSAVQQPAVVASVVQQPAVVASVVQQPAGVAYGYNTGYGNGYYGNGYYGNYASPLSSGYSGYGYNQDVYGQGYNGVGYGTLGSGIYGAYGTSSIKPVVSNQGSYAYAAPVSSSIGYAVQPAANYYTSGVSRVGVPVASSSVVSPALVTEKKRA